MKINILLVNDPRIKISIFSKLKDLKNKYRFELYEPGRFDFSCTYDLIIVDLSDIDNTGLQLLENVCVMNQNIPVIVLTNIKKEEDMGLLLKYPVHQCLLKTEISIRQISNSIYWAIEKNKEIMNLNQLAISDELTGIYNRRGFLKLARQKIKNIEKQNRSAGLFFIDINYLKQINDTYGHCEGDKVIKTVADSLKASFRENDIIARLGGDEFVVLINNEISGDVFKEIIQRIENKLKLINQKSIHDFNITVSLGFAKETPGDGNYIETLNNLLQKADENLYQSKKYKSYSSSCVVMSNYAEVRDVA